MGAITYRTESKFMLSYGAVETIRSRLRATIPMDEHSNGKAYVVKTLYFDSYAETALHQCLDGDAARTKYRLRYYNNDLSLIKLEKKIKIGTRGYKLSALVDLDEAKQLIRGETHCTDTRTEQVFRDFSIAYKTELLRPKIVMDYLREAYVFGVENTRITIDYHMRTYLGSIDFVETFFGDHQVSREEDRTKFLLEVKYNRFLPAAIGSLIQVGEAGRTSNSKYQLGRIIKSF